MRSVRVKIGAALAVALLTIGVAGPGAASACPSMDACETRAPREQRIIIDIVGAGLHGAEPGTGLPGLGR